MPMYQLYHNHEVVLNHRMEDIMQCAAVALLSVKVDILHVDLTEKLCALMNN